MEIAVSRWSDVSFSPPPLEEELAMQILPVLLLRIINIIIYHFLSRIRIDVANTMEILNKVNRRGMGRKSRFVPFGRGGKTVAANRGYKPPVLQLFSPSPSLLTLDPINRALSK